MQTQRTSEELDHLVRTLSHDMSANFMLLESSFSQLKKSLARPLRDGESPNELSGRVAHVEACLRESKRFLHDLDWLARTGGVEMAPGRVELSAVVDEVLFEQRELLARHNVAVDVRRPLPVVWCNEGRLKQIVTNLVRNAVHHGCHPQYPRITIAPAPTPGDGDANEGSATAAFRIHDNGPGIPRRFRREIFLPGRRLAEAAADGSGMGLAIVKKIVDYYGGSVYVDPDGAAGTAFVVSLPEPAGRTSEPLPDAESPYEADGHTWKLELDGRHRQRPGKRHGTLSSRPYHRP